MSHPIMFAAAQLFTTAEGRRKAAREAAFSTWGPRSTTAASQYARSILGDAAGTLDWAAPGLLGFEEHLQAFASLGTSGGRYLELCYTDERGSERISLRVSCMTCPTQQVDTVTSLEQLGQLLSQTPAWQDLRLSDGGNL